MSTPRKRLRCPCCGSTDVGWDAAARWCEETQEPVLSTVYDQGWCNECGEVDLVEELIT